MTTHTPGPWTHQNGSGTLDGRYQGFRIAGPDRKSIAAYSSAGGRRQAEQEANARLIAAAPDLLAELVMVLEWATVEKAPLRPQEIASIRAAIAKATQP